MSTYTTTIRWWATTLAGATEGTPVMDVINAARTKIFNFSYPIYDEAYRATLETKIIHHFYFREIGLETTALFQDFLNRKLNEIMPYYNQLYKSTLLDFNPFYDVDLTRTHNRQNDLTTTNQATSDASAHSDVSTKDNSSTITKDMSNATTDTDTMLNTTEDTSSTTNTTNSNTTNSTTDQDQSTNRDHSDAYSDTPQNSVSGVEALNYLTDYRKIKDVDTASSTVTQKGMDEGTGTSTVSGKETGSRTGKDSTMQTIEANGSSDFSATGSANRIETSENTRNEQGTAKNLEEYTEIVKGKQGTTSYSSMLLAFRETMLNIDMQIIEELEPLFMQLW